MREPYNSSVVTLDAPIPEILAAIADTLTESNDGLQLTIEFAPLDDYYVVYPGERIKNTTGSHLHRDWCVTVEDGDLVCYRGAYGVKERRKGRRQGMHIESADPDSLDKLAAFFHGLASNSTRRNSQNPRHLSSSQQRTPDVAHSVANSSAIPSANPKEPTARELLASILPTPR